MQKFGSMKKKKWIIPVVVIGVICVLLIGVVEIFRSKEWSVHVRS